MKPKVEGQCEKLVKLWDTNLGIFTEGPCGKKVDPLDKKYCAIHAAAAELQRQKAEAFDWLAAHPGAEYWGSEERIGKLCFSGKHYDSLLSAVQDAIQKGGE